MAPKKKKGGGGKRKKAEKFDPDDLKAFNLAERESLMFMYARMRELEERNLELKRERHEVTEDVHSREEEKVRARFVTVRRMLPTSGTARRPMRRIARFRSRLTESRHSRSS
jgi:hypothetical protein